MLEEVRIRATAKKWGNSVGVVIPKQYIDILNLKPGEEIDLLAVKMRNPLKALFGTAPRTGSTAQAIKEYREEFPESKWLKDI